MPSLVEKIRKLPNRRRNIAVESTKKVGAVAGIAALAVAAAAVVGADVVDTHARHNGRVAEIEHQNTIYQGTVLVTAGAKLREEPSKVAGPGVTGPSSIELTVPKGKTLVITNPFVKTNGSDTWVGTVKPSVSDETQGDIEKVADGMVWLDLTESQQDRLATTINPDGSRKFETSEVAIAQDGTVDISHPIGGNPATASLEDVASSFYVDADS